MIGYGQSGVDHDFFCFNAAGNVWNGSSFVAWADGSYATYRVAATELGTSGRFTATTPAGTETFELRVRGASLAASYAVWTEDLRVQRIVEADQILEDDSGTQKLKTYERGTTTELIPAKTAKQPGGADLTTPTTQLLAGYEQE